MFRYLTSGTIQRIADGALVPTDPANTDYQAYLRWIEDGNTPQPPDAPPVDPQPTIEQKLASVGLSLDDLRTALNQ